jgi:hypothetical protein
MSIFSHGIVPSGDVGIGGNDGNTVMLLRSDGAGSIINDNDGSNHNGAHSGNTTNYGVTASTSVPGVNGVDSMYFNNSSYIQITDDADYGEKNNTSYTIDFRFRGIDGGSGSNNGVVGAYKHSIAGGNCCYGDNFWTTQYDGGGLHFNSNANTYGSMAVNANQWYHICYVLTSSNMRVWKDGVLVSTTSNPGYTLVDNQNDMYIGRTWVNGDYMYGYLDQVRISKGVDRTADSNDPLYIASGTSFTPPASEYTT